MLKFVDCEFSAAGANKNAKVYGLTLEGAEDVLVDGCTFNGIGYSAILNKTAGDVTVKNTKFECDNIKNPIEGGQATAQGNLTVEDCDFAGVPGNNFINFYNVAEGSIHTVKNCKFRGGMDNNIVRLSNKGNATATFNLEDITYEYTAGEESEYTGFIICQDYTKRTGTLQDFGKYTINIDRLTRPEEGVLFYNYTDGEGIITENLPHVYVDGSLVYTATAEPFVEEEGEW